MWTIELLFQLPLETTFTMLTCPFQFPPNGAVSPSTWRKQSLGGSAGAAHWASAGAAAALGMKGPVELQVIIAIKDEGPVSVWKCRCSLAFCDRCVPSASAATYWILFKIWKTCGLFSPFFKNPFPCWDEKCNTFQLTLDFLQKSFWKRILHVKHMKSVRRWERAPF